MRLGLALCPYRCFSIGMQDDFRNCVKEKLPPPWPGATPGSFANALKMWEKEVKDSQKPSMELLGCMCAIVLGFSSFFAVCGYDGMCQATASGNDPGVPDLKGYYFVVEFGSSFTSDFALPCLVVLLCAGIVVAPCGMWAALVPYRGRPTRWTWVVSYAHLIFGSTLCVFAFIAYAKAAKAYSGDWTVLSSEANMYYGSTHAVADAYQRNSSHLGWLATFSGVSLLLSGWGLMRKASAAQNGWCGGLPSAV